MKNLQVSPITVGWVVILVAMLLGIGVYQNQVINKQSKLIRVLFQDSQRCMQSPAGRGMRWL